MSKLSENISVDLSYVYQDTKNRETGGELAYSPQHNAKITGKFLLPTRTKVETIVKAVSHSYSSPDTIESQKLDAYCVVNTKIIQLLESLLNEQCII